MRAILPRALLSSLIVLAACGDDDDGGPAHDCQVPASPALPSEGEITRASDLPLPDTCVPGGLRTLPGRWFIADLSTQFTFLYPRYAGSCTEGFRNEFGRPIDTDDSDGLTFHVWSDGTTYFERRYIRYQFEDGSIYEIVRAMAVCVTPDGELAAAFGNYDTERGFRASSGTGEHFALKDGPAEGLERVGSLATATDGTAIVGYNVVVEGDFAYVVGTEGLDIIDVTDPAAPVHVGHAGGPVQELDGMNDVRVVRGATRTIAFGSALGGEATYVIDVTDPTQPMYLANIPEYSHSVQVRVDGERTYLYLATYTANVPVYDITDPAQPVRLGAPTVPDGDDAGIHDLTVSDDGNMIYANNTTDGVVAIDVSAGLDQPAVERWRMLTSYSHASWSMTTSGGRRILLHGDEGMTPEGGAFLRIIDDDAESPTYGELIGRYQSRPQVGIHNIQAIGDKVYLSYYQDGVRILDVADPTQPREIAHYNTWDEATARGGAFEGAVGVRKVGDYIYVADIAQGLIILRETATP